MRNPIVNFSSIFSLYAAVLRTAHFSKLFYLYTKEPNKHHHPTVKISTIDTASVFIFFLHWHILLKCQLFWLCTTVVPTRVNG
ncbi:hypothetical protein SLA2020_463560 [Shorea laevis]